MVHGRLSVRPDQHGQTVIAQRLAPRSDCLGLRIVSIRLAGLGSHATTAVEKENRLDAPAPGQVVSSRHENFGGALCAGASSIGGSQGAGQDCCGHQLSSDPGTKPRHDVVLAPATSSIVRWTANITLRKTPMSQFDSRLTITIHLYQDRVTS
jgi:hypothetical protein